MPLIKQIIKELEQLAPPSYQESYDNAGLLTGDASWDCTGVICTLDCTEAVVLEAISRNCNLIVTHHPIIFSGLKKITGAGYVEKTLITAIKNDIAIYAIHTNLDNVQTGVNHIIANKLGLIGQSVLVPKTGILGKLYTYVPVSHADAVKEALFAAGAGNIGNYAECSFSGNGTGTFKPVDGANPFRGTVGIRETGSEIKIEVLFPLHLQNTLLQTLFKTHPYETVAYEVVKLENRNQQVGAGIIGRLPGSITETAFFALLKERFGLRVIRHTPFLNKPVRSVAVCGGSGSFLTKAALAAAADIYVTADVKYHEFFDAENKLLIADIGHWESEQFTGKLLADYLQEKFPTFAVLLTEVNTNPVQYFS